MEIRKLIDTDALKVSEVYARSWKTAYKDIVPQTYLKELSLDRWTPFLKVSPYTGFVLIDDDKYIATSSVSQARDECMGGWGEIISIYVLPEYFGRGYGTKLFSCVVDYLKRQGYDKIYLWVLGKNNRARVFYEHNGFIPTKDISTINIGGKELTEIRYVNFTK